MLIFLLCIYKRQKYGFKVSVEVLYIDMCEYQLLQFDFFIVLQFNKKKMGTIYPYKNYFLFIFLYNTSRIANFVQTSITDRFLEYEIPS